MFDHVRVLRRRAVRARASLDMLDFDPGDDFDDEFDDDDDFDDDDPFVLDGGPPPSPARPLHGRRARAVPIQAQEAQPQEEMTRPP